MLLFVALVGIYHVLFLVVFLNSYKCLIIATYKFDILLDVASMLIKEILPHNILSGVVPLIILLDSIHLTHSCLYKMDTLCFTKHFYYLILNIKQARLQHCIADLDASYCFNGLRLNSSKSEAILLGTRQHLLSFPTVPSVNIASSLVTVTDQITTLGIIIDKRFIFVCLQSSRNLFSSSCPEALAFLSYRGHGCIQCKCSGSIPP